MAIGSGTLLNVCTIVVGSALGVMLGVRLPNRTRAVVTDALGLVTLLVGGLDAAAVQDAALGRAVGSSAPVLIVLGSLLIGGIAGSLLGIEARLEQLGGRLRHRFARPRPHSATGTLAPPPPGAEANAGRERFVEGFVTASLVYCVGPLAILGALSDGLGHGIRDLVLKSTLDGFASIAFAAALGWGVAAAALPVLVLQGTFTLVGALMGDVLPQADMLALTAVGGLLLIGVGIRLLRVRDLPVADLLPALLVAPLLVEAVAHLR